MNLSELATKPNLVKITIKQKELVEKYGDEIYFYILDRLPIGVFTKLASLQSEDLETMYKVMQDLILDEKGLPIMNEEKVLPVDVMTEAVTQVSDYLGKSVK